MPPTFYTCSMHAPWRLLCAVASDAVLAQNHELAILILKKACFPCACPCPACVRQALLSPGEPCGISWLQHALAQAPPHACPMPCPISCPMCTPQGPTTTDVPCHLLAASISLSCPKPSSSPALLTGLRPRLLYEPWVWRTSGVYTTI